jgi:hypothetical protein
LFECVALLCTTTLVWFGVWVEMSIGGTINLCVNRKDMETFDLLGLLLNGFRQFLECSNDTLPYFLSSQCFGKTW